MKLSNAWYDALKWVAQIALPAIGAAYFTLAQLWGLPSAEEVVGSITVVDVLLGALLGLSTGAYNRSDAKYDGVMEVEEHEEGTRYGLVLNSNPEELADKQEIVFRVEPK